jgi:hypothetical protein
VSVWVGETNLNYIDVTYIMNYYAHHYIDDTNGNEHITIYEGVYYKQSTRGNITYPAAKPIGNINITTRQFYSLQHFLRKISTVQNDRIFLHNNREPYILINILLQNLGYNNDIINDIVTAINKFTNMKKLVSGPPCSF